MKATEATGTPPPARFPVDLQVHTTCSDGSMTPSDVVAWAARVGVQVLAITDHDAVDGVAGPVRVLD